MPRAIDPISRKPKVTESQASEVSHTAKSGKFFQRPGSHQVKQLRSDSTHNDGLSNVPSTAERLVRLPNNQRGRIVKALVLIFFVIFLMTGVLATVSYMRQRQAKVEAAALVNTACVRDNQGLVGDGIAAVNSQNFTVLKVKTDSIKNIKHYDSDQTCLALIAWQQMFMGEFDNAQGTIDKIKPIYDASLEQGSNQAIYVGNPERMESYLSTFRQSYEKSKNSGSVYQSKSSGAKR